jgi:hypothetical protein
MTGSSHLGDFTTTSQYTGGFRYVYISRLAASSTAAAREMWDLSLMAGEWLIPLHDIMAGEGGAHSLA